MIIDTPKTARNTDGIDPGNSANVTITRCYVNSGDDNVAIKAGHGAPTTHMTISHNHFYAGHGVSIGSETDGGASAIRVSDLSIDGADNGIRIKSNSSRGGLVHDIVTLDGFDATHRLSITFDNVTIDDPAITRISGIHALGPGPVNFRPAGDDLKIEGAPGQGGAKRLRRPVQQK